MKSYEARRPSYFATPAVNHYFALKKGTRKSIPESFYFHIYIISLNSTHASFGYDIRIYKGCLLISFYVGFEILLANGGMEKRFEEHHRMSTAIKNAIKSLGCTFVCFFYFFTD
jgi:alanine-glyoxylate transaminase/serine-glyoxylate transaminase/serine-pyruvate transaminase